jgi:dipeptidyl aminopeptidase/acylaminoacyl peptidase
MMKKWNLIPAFLCLVSIASAQQAKRPLRPGDIYRLQSLTDAHVSFDGKWIVYTITTIDSVKDKRNSDIWMTSWDGTANVQLTSSPESETSPRFSPDGKYISFIAKRNGDKSQVFLLDRRGGEGIQLTKVKGALEGYEWSPDGKKIALVMHDEEDTAKNKPPKPYVINKFNFKKDITGYQYDTTHSHLYLFDVASKTMHPLTKGIYEENDFAWSPDGSKIAFTSNHTKEIDQNENTDIFVVDTTDGAIPKQLTTWSGADGNPEWSPDGKWIAYLRSASDALYEMYNESVLCVIPATGGEPKVLSASLDRPVSNEKWSLDGKSIAALIADDMQRYVALFNPNKGTMTKLAGGDKAFTYVESVSGGKWLTSMTNTETPAELYAIEGGNVRRLTTIQNKFLDSLTLATGEKFVSTSKDGTKVSGIIYYPPNGGKTNLPVIFYIHGGPVSQDEFAFDMTRQMFAAHGYAVVGINYRGSNGRGVEYSRTISGDWGNKEVMDILGANDYLILKGIIDSSRMAMSGWSYGGILTDYVIASTNRFKAASSGAGVAAPLSLFGVDQYINQYVNEIGLTWKEGNIDKYLKLSYPFLHANRITTPTQFMVGEKDFNVPAVGSEQMYQALRIVGVPTELLDYPNQFHGFTQPSFIKDRYERYFTWFDRYLKPSSPMAVNQ